MKHLISTISFIFISFGAFSQKNPQSLDRIYSSVISEEFYRKLGYEVITKSKVICCAENPDSTYEVLTITLPSDPVYYAESSVDLEDYYSNVLSEGQINLLTDYLVRKVKRNKKSLGIVDCPGVKVFSCLEMVGEFRTKKYSDNKTAIYGTFTFKLYFISKLKIF